MQRTERHIILNNYQVDHLCFLSKNLYNLANYYIRQEYFKTKRWVRYYELDKLLQKTEDYKFLPSSTSQQILMLLDKSWVSFFKAVKIYQKSPDKFKSNPKLPGYKDKIKGRNIIVFTNKQAKIKDGFIYFPKKANISPIKTKVSKESLNQVRIIPQATCYVLEVVYTKEVKSVETYPNTYLSIDLGVNNLATCVNNIGNKPFVVNGRVLKSINQYFNKRKTELQSYVGVRGNSNRLKRLTYKRNCKVDDYLHKTSRFVLDYCIKYKISTIVIGKNSGWKQGVNLGKKTNQNFVSIPFDKLIHQIQYKAEEVGIKVITNEESYTSKCSFLDLEPIEKHVNYKGKRIKRGLFKSSIGRMVNADVNGACNILRKVIPNAFGNGIEGVGLHPVIVRL